MGRRRRSPRRSARRCPGPPTRWFRDSRYSTAGDGDGRGLLRLAEFLIGLLALVELGGEGLGRTSAQGLLDEPAGLAALAAGEAAGLDPGLTGRADGDPDGLQATPPSRIVTSIEPSARGRSTTWWPRLRASIRAFSTPYAWRKRSSCAWSPQRLVVVVVADLPRGGVHDDGVEPAGQRDEQAGGLALEQRGGAVDRLGQSEPEAGGVDGRGVADLGLDLDDVAHFGPPRCACRWGCRRDGAAAGVGADAATLPGVGTGPGVRRVGPPPNARLLGTYI